MLLPPAKLSLSFDAPDRRYQPGSVVRGRVDVSSSSSFTCNSLVVTLHWATHGKGDADRDDVATDVIAVGVTIPAGSTSFAFSLQLPADATPTYRGRVLNLDWYVTARADVSLAIDPRVTEDIVVLLPRQAAPAGPMRGSFFELVHHSSLVPVPALKPASSGSGVVLSHGTAAALGGVFLGGAGIYAALFSQQLREATAAGFFALVGVALLGTSLPKVLSAAALRALTVHVGPLVQSPYGQGFIRGGPLACVVFARGSRRGRVKGVTLWLAARETTKRKRGTSTEVHTEIHAMAKETVRHVHVRSRGGAGAYRGAPPMNESPLFEGAPEGPEEGCAEYRHVFAIPPDAPATFSTANSSVSWIVRVQVELQGAPDWDEQYPIPEVRW